MTDSQLPEVFPSDALIDRLSDGVRRSGKPVVFLLGSAIAAPPSGALRGVPNVAGVIELIRAEFETTRRVQLDQEIAIADNKYQTAFKFLRSRRGQSVVNEIIRKAVFMARRDESTSSNGAKLDISRVSEAECRDLEEDCNAWDLPPAVKSIGALVVDQPTVFGNCILTTNFDPLIEVSIARAGGAFYKTVLHLDGDLRQTEARGSHVVHLHGYWYGTDTLHTPRQITQHRPRLRASLQRLLQEKTLVVLGYGGWDDVVTRTLIEIIQDDRETLDVVWTFYGSAAGNEKLLAALHPGLDRGRVTLYEGIDCHTFLPKLHEAWSATAETKPSPSTPIDVQMGYSPPAEPVPAIANSSGAAAISSIHFDVEEEDHPPSIDHYVGREEESRRL